MIELKKEFKRNGVNFKQVYKDSDLAIYKTGFNSFEVFSLIVHKPDVYHNDYYEMYPCSEYFGKCAWSCSDENSVQRILKEHFKNHKLTVNGFICSGR